MERVFWVAEPGATLDSAAVRLTWRVTAIKTHICDICELFPRVKEHKYFTTQQHVFEITASLNLYFSYQLARLDTAHTQEKGKKRKMESKLSCHVMWQCHNGDR